MLSRLYFQLALRKPCRKLLTGTTKLMNLQEYPVRSLKTISSVRLSLWIVYRQETGICRLIVFDLHNQHQLNNSNGIKEYFVPVKYLHNKNNGNFVCTNSFLSLFYLYLPARTETVYTIVQHNCLDFSPI